MLATHFCFHTEACMSLHYFADYYEHRIVAAERRSRLGTFPDAPMAADDFYDLHESLISVYHRLLTLPSVRHFVGFRRSR
jgi:hypothetical protein